MLPFDDTALTLPSTTAAQMVSKTWSANDVQLIPADIIDWLGQDPSTSWLQISTAPTLGRQLIPRGTKAFRSKGLPSPGLSLLRKYTLSTIRSFPRRILSTSDTPPFIPPMWLTEEIRHSEDLKPGPLSRCTGIMSLWFARNANNEHYVWKILRNEQERLFEDTEWYSDWNAVAALQALTIYFLVRVSAENDEDADFDIPLIMTMSKLSLRVRGITARHCDPSSQSRPTWEGWLIVECLRRTLAALFIIDFLFDLSPGLSGNYCDSARLWSEMLVPSAKQLWAATSRLQWEREYRALDGDRRPTFGELLRHNSIDKERGQLLERWMGQADEFGSLAINAASLAEIVV